MLPLFELYTGMLPVVEAQTRSYCETILPDCFHAVSHLPTHRRR